METTPIVTASSAQEQVSASSINAPNPAPVRILINNIHRLVSKKELLKAVQEKCGDQVNISSCNIICIGPKSTGRGSVEVSSVEEALLVIKLAQGLSLNDQPLELALPNTTRNQHNREKKKQRKPKKKVELPFQAELDQLKEKYKEKFQLVSDKYPVTIKVAMKPSDPDFPFDLAFLSVQFEISDQYPEVPPEIKILNTEIPEKILTNMLQSTKKRAESAYKNKPMLLGLLRYLDLNLERFLADRPEGPQLELWTPDKILSKFKEEAQKTEEEQKDGKMEEEDEEDYSEEDEEGEEESSEEEAQPAPPSNFATSTAHKGTQMKAAHLKLTGIGIARCTKLPMVILCGRCKNQLPVELQHDQVIDKECDKCHNHAIIGFRAETMHENCFILGYLDLEECTPFDILPECVFQCVCFNCSTEVPIKKVSVSGDTQTSSVCTSCHANLNLAIDQVKFIKIRATVKSDLADKKVIVQSAKPKKEKIPGIKVGSPLPDNGTCKHYKRSFRWFRFPCCGRVFPCDECHEENNKDKHEMVRANRILCGNCAREQPAANKMCKCGFSFETGMKGFWEAGKGQRDPSKMNRKDSHKYSGLNKTVSQKQTRVGPKKKPTTSK